MSLQINDRTYLQAKEAANALGVTLGHFNNLRSQRGNDFIEAHPLIAGRVFYCALDVRRLAAERGR